MFYEPGGWLWSGTKKESWMELCGLAAQETDPKKLMALIAEIDRLLEGKHQCVAAPGSVTEKSC